ncbi:PEP-CTERM sorting domain-containing protein [Planctomycetota bacterium]|nr:PEP-CTERM sorting domain-containing protein [Planctomycetota bacterium]
MNIIKSIFTCTIAALTLTATSHAAPILILHPDIANKPNLAIAVEGIIVDGVTYNATFHTGTSFNAIWDPNNDADFTDGITGLAPAFFDNSAGAISAYDQVSAALGTAFKTRLTPQSDGFFVPFKHPTDNTSVSVLYDKSPTLLSSDTRLQSSFPKTLSTNTSYAWTTFTPVPEPTTLALLILTTLPLIIRRKHII